MNHLGSAALSEAELADQMELCIYPTADFHHADHIRLAWYYLRANPDTAVERMRQTILRYASSLGHPEKYHDTVTIAWMRLVATALLCTPQSDDFTLFLAGHCWLLNRDGLLAFYSKSRLFADDARASWVVPDVHPLPHMCESLRT